MRRPTPAPIKHKAAWPRWTTHALLTTVLICAGCSPGPTAPGGTPLYASPQVPQPEHAGAPPEATRQTTPIPAEIERLHARLAKLESANNALQKQLSDQYMQQIADRQARLNGTGTDAASDRGLPGAAPSALPDPPPRRQGGKGLDTATQAELLEALAKRIETSDEPQRVKALTAAAMSVVARGNELDHRTLDKLDPRSREQVARFHQMLAVTYDELATNPNKPLSRREMIEQIDKVFGAQPLSIEALQLCRRVDSYGVYQPFATTRFLAGRKNRVLVYVELDHFHHEPTADGDYQVKLEQQVELYDTTGETTVWRQGPVELVDVSRNKRRDFFIVYPVDLPARLPAGGYRLKVRVADKHTGSICEKTLHDLQIVADTSLVDKNHE